MPDLLRYSTIPCQCGHPKCDNYIVIDAAVDEPMCYNLSRPQAIAVVQVLEALKATNGNPFAPNNNELT